MVLTHYEALQFLVKLAQTMSLKLGDMSPHVLFKSVLFQDIHRRANCDKPQQIFRVPIRQAKATV